MKLCQSCYSYAIFVSYGLPGGGNFGAFLSMDFNEKFVYTRDHSECDSCNKTLKEAGYCNCDDLQLSNMLEPFNGKKKSCLTIFHHSAGHWAITDKGSFLEFWEVKISNFLADCDLQEVRTNWLWGN